MKKSKKLAAMLLVLAILVVLIAVVRSGETDEDTVSEAVQILSVEEADVTAFGWQFGDTEYRFLQSDSGWSYPADESFPVSPTTMSALLEALNGMTADRVLTDVEDLGEYGLDAPQCVITLEGDAAYTISIGGESAMGGSRYVTLDGQTVYMTDESILSEFTVELYSMLRQESIPNMDDINAVKIQRKDGTLELRRETDGDGKTVWHGLDGKEEITLDGDLTEDFTDDIGYLYWSTTVEHNADAKALKGYGLQKPAATLTITYAVNEQVATDLTDSDGNAITGNVTKEYDFVLELGDTSPNGVYARLQDSSMVYEVNEAYAYEIMEIEYEHLMASEE